MKITLDVGKLLKTGKITKAEHDRFAELAKSSTGSHAFSILFVLAAIAVALGFFGLNAKLFFDVTHALYEAIGKTGIHVLVIALLFFGGLASNSGFLIGLAPFMILGLLGGSTFYSHATYFVAIEEPALTVVVFTILALGALRWSTRVEFDRERLALIFARVCMIIVNMGFWIGSLWGSDVGQEYQTSSATFSILWAAALLAVGLWGAKVGRRFVVNTCAVFGSIHFYTQWFVRLGASPGSLLVAGLIALGIMYGLRTYNRGFKR